MIRQTQVESYEKLQPDLSRRQTEVYDCLKSSRNGLTNRGVAKLLGWDINRVTGRMNELVAKDAVTGDTTVFDSQTQRTVTLWKVT
jgi:hypothetical protein